MNVLVLTPAPYDTAPGQRFRIEQWARRLESQGFTFTFIPFEDDVLHRVIYQRGKYFAKGALMLRAFLRRLVVAASVRRYDVVFLPREAAMIGPAIIERIIAVVGVPIVYDFDDPIWLPYSSPTNGIFSRLRWPRKTAAICRLATRVIVGNRLLADWACKHSQAVDVVPSTIELRNYPIKPTPSETSAVTLGWTGSHSTLPFLDSLRGVLQRLTRKHEFRLLIVSHTDRLPAETWPVEVIARRWNATTEAIDLHAIDIGLGPFPNSGWTPWRCHGKVLQYMAVGVPCVVSRLGILPDYIEEGVSGFLANRDEEWEDRLSLLIEDAALRQRFGQAGRITIEREYSAEVWAPQLARILRAAAGVSTENPASANRPSERQLVESSSVD